MPHVIPRIDICSISESENEAFMIQKFSDYLKIHPNLMHAHRHSFFHLVFFTEGGGRHTIDFNHFNLFPNQIYFMVPGQVHAWNFEGNVDGFIVNFTKEFFQYFLNISDYITSFPFFKGSPKDSVLNLSQETGKLLIQKFTDILDQSVQHKVYKYDLIRVRLLEIFLLIAQNNDQEKENSHTHMPNTLVQSYQDLIEKNYMNLRKPSEYARLLAVTPNHLNALTKEHLGMQAGEVIRDRIILEAKRLLINVDLSVSQIAYKLQFSDNSYFTKFFKKYVGINPEEFRKNYSLHF
jgi:AraC family transcriptional activator of pobA